MEQETAKRVQAVQGYAELGMFEEAEEELSDLSPDLEIVEMLRCDLLSRQSKWGEMRAVAERLAQRSPEEAQWWISWAYAVRRAESVRAARGILEEAREKHPSEAMIVYNLACYSSVLGDLDEARRLLGQAIKMDPAFKGVAKDDDDLKPLFQAGQMPF